ncbi:MAG: hypothetical protein A2V88_08760 [Elusimicrobia bacterium RBG_16_66_12]|nr:MAG: hypothetical protein A2V88_08760 [Elusimicrobia bacterium RBG_16_66_12]
MGQIRGLATADLHLGIDNVGGVNEYGLPARVDDYLAALDQIVDHAVAEKVDLFILAGDLTKQRNTPQRIVAALFERFQRLIGAGITILLVRGNHDGDSGEGRANLLDTAGYLSRLMMPINRPEAFVWENRVNDKACRIAGIPWPRIGRAEGRPLDELTRAADESLRVTIRDLCQESHMPQILIGHLAVAGADRASDQWMTLGYEPLIRPADFPESLDLVILGHYHKPGRLDPPLRRAPMFYCGSPVIIDFGEEGQAKRFWYFELDGSRPPGERCTKLEALPLPGRPFVTVDFEIPASAQPSGDIIDGDGLREGRHIDGCVVRLRIKCATAEQAAALNLNAVAASLREAGAWWVAGITLDSPRPERRWSAAEGITEQSPQELLMRYLSDAEPDETRRGRLFELAMMEASHDTDAH